MTKSSKPKPKRGKPVNLYLREEDVAKVRELTAAVAAKGERTSDSLIVRAAIQSATPGKAFMDAYKQAASADMRFKPSEE
jgi:hypothetical protein